MSYKVGDEFIVKIKEVMDSDNGTLYRSNFNTLVFDEYGLDKLQKVEDNCIPYNIAYEQGLQDAWKLARKISDISTTYERADMFGYCCNGITVTDVLRDFTPQEALAKLEAYEESKAIKVGDVVTTTNGTCKYIVTNIQEPNTLHVINSQNGYVQQMRKDVVKKTGKTVDIQHLLEQIRGNE